MLILALAFSILWPPLTTYAQQAGKVSRIGFLGATSAADLAIRVEALRAGLRDLGYVEGKNLVFEFRWAEGQYERLPALAAELLELRIDLLAALGTSAVHVAKSATAKSTPTIPVVFSTGSDPGQYMSPQLARNGGRLDSGFTTAIGGAADLR